MTPSPLPIDPLDVEAPGGKLGVYRFGAPAANAPVVLAVHGITSNSHTWRPLARALAGRATIVAPDLRGRAASRALPGPFGIGAHVDDLIAILDQVGVRGPLVVVGHSLGAYIAARLATDHPERVRHAILVDGGLTIPGSESVDPQEFLDAFLGPALARLKLTFGSCQEYRDWWRAHPAFGGEDIADSDLIAYADHDLVGDEPELHSSVIEQAVRGDASGLMQEGSTAHALTVASTLLCAPRGLVDDPNPMQPLAAVRAWAADAPQQRSAVPVPNCNHYTIILGQPGAAAVADAVEAALAD